MVNLRAMKTGRSISFIGLAVLSVACDRSPPEPVKADNTPYATTPSANGDNGGAASGGMSGGTSGGATTTNGDMSGGGATSGGRSQGDPLAGHFTLQDALKGINGTGALLAKIDTSKGALECRLYEDKAPITVANFVGLATGKRPWKTPQSQGGSWVTKPAYDGTTFHRIIRGFMIQGGDAAGDGSGEPGYVIKDEVWDGAKHNRAGLLCMANRGPDTNGAQFFITDAAAPHLDKSYTIFGECAPEQIVHDIAGVQTGARDKPLTPVMIKTVTIQREKPADKK
jgi:peptidyl-prolyl cis-trans isomerase A (cyclophilin A)